MENKDKGVSMEDIVSLAKRRGFIYPGSDIYGGLAGTWDYGPMGVALKNNIKNLWWRMFVDMRDDMYGVDAAILMNPKVWEASGHVAGFSDPLVECLHCHTRFRADNLIENIEGYLNFLQLIIKEVVGPGIKDNKKDVGELKKINEALEKSSGLIKPVKEKLDNAWLKAWAKTFVSASSLEELKKAREFRGIFAKAYLELKVPCPNCKKSNWNEPKQFNMMFKTSIGAIDDGESISYLRPETAGGIFMNFKNVMDSLHPKMPFGIAQIGKAFRNEIAPRDFIFRDRELEQMEVEYFIHPSQWEQAFDEWRQIMQAWLSAVGIDTSKVVEHEIADGDRAHYSKRTIDFEFQYPFGLKELYGLAYRTDFDLSAHSAGSKVDLSYFDEETKERFVPHVIEPSLGVERTILAVLVSAYHEEGEGDDKRIVLKLPAHIAPIKAAVSPLLKNKPELVAKAREVYGNLKLSIPQIMWDDNGNIGKRYRRQDEIGTPWCITIDFDTLENDTVTVRNRDTMQQERIAISDLLAKINS